MNPDSVNFGVSRFSNQTNIHPLVLLATLVFVVIVFLAPRRFALVPLLIAQSFIVDAQRIYFVGVNFTIIRILICVALLRIVLRKEYIRFVWTTLDKVVMVYGIVSILTYTIQAPGLGSFSYSTGTALDNIGGFLIVRVLVRDDEDIRVLVDTLMVMVLILWVFFVYEAKTGMNIFNAIGDPLSRPEIRDGRIRAQGAYPHSLLAGSFWAAVIPLFIGYKDDRGKASISIWLGVIAGIVIIFSCASSTPLMSLIIGIGATILFYQRASLGNMKLLLIAGFFGLVFFWSKPIWYLFTKIDLTGGSTGFFRYLLVDRFIMHWREWFLFGVRSTFKWGAGLDLGAVGLADLPNQYVFEGVRGGALGLVLFIASIIIAFKYIGVLLKNEQLECARFHYWQIGVCLLVHLFNFMGVSYFGQVKFTWWMSLAFVACLYQRKILISRSHNITSFRLGYIAYQNL